MGVASCLFVVHGAGSCPHSLDGRIESLVRFYGPLGARAAMTAEAGGCALVGEIEFDSVDGGRGRERSKASPTSPWLAEWGGPLPAELRSPHRLLDATDDELRRIRGIGVSLAFDDGEVRLVTSPVGPTALYGCASGELMVWSTHATAAAWLARGDVALRGDALPEFLGCEFVGGDKTHLEDVRAIPACVRIDLRADGHSESVYWALADRWAAVPSEDAADVAEAALLASLDGRLRDCNEPLCGLTAGADSRVVALALREVLDGGFRAFTWGEEGSADVTGAETVARELEVPHVRCGFTWHADDEIRAAAESAVRWSDGLEPVRALGRPEVPLLPSAIVTGRGGETGRAFFYRFAPGVRNEPRRSDLVDAVIGHPTRRLQGASRDAHEMLRASVSRWLDFVAESGHRGWRLLDVAYGEQRLTRWDRTRLMRQESLYVPAFDDPEVQRALASLPLEELLGDGFHRRFIGKRNPRLLPPAPAAPRRGVPVPIRRAARMLRAWGGGARDGDRWFLAHEWSKRPQTQEWIADELLAHPLLEQVFGAKWVSRLRNGFVEGEAIATQSAFLLAAPLALERAARRM